jgi:hypothetical protein
MRWLRGMALIVVCPGRCISLTRHEEVRFRLIVNKVKANLPRRHEARRVCACRGSILLLHVWNIRRVWLHTTNLPMFNEL